MGGCVSTPGSVGRNSFSDRVVVPGVGSGGGSVVGLGEISGEARNDDVNSYRAGVGGVDRGDDVRGGDGHGQDHRRHSRDGSRRGGGTVVEDISVRSVRSVQSVQSAEDVEDLEEMHVLEALKDKVSRSGGGFEDEGKVVFKTAHGEEVRMSIVSRFRPSLPGESRRGSVDEQNDVATSGAVDVAGTTAGRAGAGAGAASPVSAESSATDISTTVDAFACAGYLQLRVLNKRVGSKGGAETETLTVRTTHLPMLRPLPVYAQFDAMTSMLATLLGCDMVEVKLTPEEMQWHVNAGQQLGTLAVDSKFLEESQVRAEAEVMRGEKLCPLLMLPPNQELMVVPDMRQNDVYKNHPRVAGDPNLRFFAAAWLVSPDDMGQSRRRRRSQDGEGGGWSVDKGQKLGVLYMADKAVRDPRSVEDIEVILRETAKVVTMAIDEYKLEAIQKLLVMERKRRKSVDVKSAIEDSLSDGPWVVGGNTSDDGDDGDDGVGKMVSAVDCFQDGCMLLECIVGTKFSVGWNVVHVNESLSEQLGCDAQSMIGHGFWEYFMTDITDRSFTNSLVRQNRPFELSVTFQNTLHPKPAMHVLEFRPTVAVGSSGNVTPKDIRSLSPDTSQNRTEMAKFFSATSTGSGVLPERRDDSRSKKISSVTAALMGSTSSVSSTSVDDATLGARDALRDDGKGAPILPGRDISGLLQSAISAGERSDTSYSIRGSEKRTSGEVKRYYFAHVRPGSMGAIGVPGRSLQLSKEAPRVFKDIRLGPLIGRGAYGRVYRGNWNGNIVAVKVITSEQKLAENHVKENVSGVNRSNAKGLHEAVLSSALSHPNVLHTYQYSFRHVPAPGASWSRGSDGSASPPRDTKYKRNDSGGSDRTDNSEKFVSELWLVSEFCNRGPLLTAIENGLFMIHASNAKPTTGIDAHPAGSQTNLIYILQTAQEISAAMEYLHGHDVVHGDLTGGNVLLQSSDKDGRGFTAKVVDFGLSRVCSGGSLKTSRMGCAEYMPPELITRGLLTKAGDVYAFGVILWELYMGKRAWAGVEPSEVLTLVSKGKSLEYPSHTPRRLKILGERCLSTSMEARPRFSDVIHEVNTILADTMSILRNFLGISGS